MLASDRIMRNWEGCRRKLSLPVVKAFEPLPGGTEENYSEVQLPSVMRSNLSIF
jgi:hypothetical protein